MWLLAYQLLGFASIVQSACTARLDLVFILDGSKATSLTDLKHFLTFSWTITQVLKTNGTSLRVGAIIYGSEISKPIFLSENVDILMSTNYVPPGGDANLTDGLLNARGIFRYGRKDKATQIAVIISAGHGILTKQTFEQAKMARNERIRIITTLYHQVNNTNEWDRLSWKTEFNKQYRNIHELINSQNSTVRTICSVAETPPEPTTHITGRRTVTKGTCIGFTINENMGYKRHPSDCTKVIQCHLDTQTIAVATCSSGEFWDQYHLACRPMFLVNCPQDMCRLRLVTKFPVVGCCNAYIECQNGRSVFKYCPSGTSYFPRTGCTHIAYCGSVCSAVDEPSQGGCQNKPIYGQPTVYKHYVRAGYWVEKACQTGTTYNETKCTCSEKSTNKQKLKHDKKSDCQPILYLPFCQGVRDHSGHNTYVVNEENQVVFRNSKAYFNGRSKLSVPILSNKRLGDTVIIKLKYKIMRDKEVEDDEDSTDIEDLERMYDDDDFEDDKLMTLWSNGHCYKRGRCQEEPSLTMSTNRVSSSLHVITAPNETSSIILDKVSSEFDYEIERDYEYMDDMDYRYDTSGHDPDHRCQNDTWSKGWRTAVFMLNRKTLAIYDQDVYLQRTIKGPVQQKYFGIHFGQGLGLGGFRGYMDEIYIYMCQPDHDHLFDGIDSSISELDQPFDVQNPVTAKPSTVKTSFDKFTKMHPINSGPSKEQSSRSSSLPLEKPSSPSPNFNVSNQASPSTGGTTVDTTLTSLNEIESTSDTTTHRHISSSTTFNSETTQNYDKTMSSTPQEIYKTYTPRQSTEYHDLDSHADQETHSSTDFYNEITTSSYDNAPSVRTNTGTLKDLLSNNRFTSSGNRLRADDSSIISMTTEQYDLKTKLESVESASEQTDFIVTTPNYIKLQTDSTMTTPKNTEFIEDKQFTTSINTEKPTSKISSTPIVTELQTDKEIATTSNSVSEESVATAKQVDLQTERAVNVIHAKISFRLRMDVENEKEYDYEDYGSDEDDYGDYDYYDDKNEGNPWDSSDELRNNPAQTRTDSDITLNRNRSNTIRTDDKVRIGLGKQRIGIEKQKSVSDNTSSTPILFTLVTDSKASNATGSINRNKSIILQHIANTTVKLHPKIKTNLHTTKGRQNSSQLLSYSENKSQKSESDITNGKRTREKVLSNNSRTTEIIDYLTYHKIYTDRTDTDKDKTVEQTTHHTDDF